MCYKYVKVIPESKHDMYPIFHTFTFVAHWVKLTLGKIKVYCNLNETDGEYDKT